MPIDADQFEELEHTIGPTPGTNAADILSFLRENPRKAFRQKEIAERTDVTPGSIGPTLVRLRDDGLVEHRGRYWRYSPGEGKRLLRLGESSGSGDDVGYEFEEWREYAPIIRDEES